MFPSNSTTYIFQQVAVSLFHCLTMAAFLSSVYRRRYIFMTYISHIVASYMSILCYMLKDFLHIRLIPTISQFISSITDRKTLPIADAPHTHTHTHTTHTHHTHTQTLIHTTHTHSHYTHTQHTHTHTTHTHTTHTRYLCRFSDKLVCIISGWCTLIQN